MPRVAAHPDWPSVTEILKDTGLVRGSDFIPERYRERGRALHEVIAMYLDGVDVSDVAAELRPGLEGYLAFQQHEGFYPLHSELELVHPCGVVGHLDLVGYLPPSQAGVILDIKYTEAPDLKGATLQLAGYRMLWDHNYPDKKIEQCYVLQLSPKSGKYRLRPVTDDYARTIFQAALVVFNAKGKR
jgi:hypothetical protein